MPEPLFETMHDSVFNFRVVLPSNAFYSTNAVVNLVALSEKAGREASAIIGQSIAASRALEDALAAPVPSRSHLALVV